MSRNIFLIPVFVAITIQLSVGTVQITDLGISSCSQTPTEATIRWKADPASEQGNVRYFTFEYTNTPEDASSWISRTTSNSQIELNNLIPATEYHLKITPVGNEAHPTSSWIIKTATPAPQSPIEGISTSSLCDSNDVCTRTLKWKLKDNVDASKVFRTEIKHSQDDEKPESEWNKFVVSGKATETDITNLPDGTTFFTIYPNTYEGTPKFSPIFQIDLKSRGRRPSSTPDVGKPSGSTAPASCSLNKAKQSPERSLSRQVSSNRSPSPNRSRSPLRSPSRQASQGDGAPRPVLLDICQFAKRGKIVVKPCPRATDTCVMHANGFGRDVNPPYGVCVPPEFADALL